MGTVYLALREAEVWLAGAALAGVVGLVAWATATRVLGVPDVRVLELTQILFAWTCLLSASVAYRRSTLFAVDMLADWLRPGLRPFLTMAQAAIVLAMVAALGWVSLDFVALAGRRPLPLTGIPYSWVAATIPVACVLMAMTAIETMLATLRDLRTTAGGAA
ncbi:MAG: TRAP transporter small permease subunit [Rhodobacteraceae bacterium]|jgi:TRAP-type C4-dicarboxylate transport system permease small subunit|nr:TRAP transporter small permease subunit [Paracoccaceae bacterium]